MNRRIRNARHYGNAALAVALLGAWIAAQASIGPALAQAGGGAPVAYLFCYTGSGATTSPTSFAPCSGSNPLAVTGGGGGGGAVTIADGADVTQGALADAAATAGGAGTVSAKLRLMTTQLGTLNTTLGTPFQAGGSIANTAFGISGTLPAFTATPTFNFGTLNGAATAANQTGGGQKTQIVDGSGNVISSTANALDINIKSGSTTVAASENHIGEVGGNILPITNAMTTSNATVTTGQSIGGIQTLANAVRVSGSLGASGTSGIIQSVVITFLDAVATSEIDVYFYNATVTTGSNCQNATTFVLQTADRTNVLGIAKVTDFTSSNTAVVAQANNLAIPFGLASSTSLFACLVAKGSFAITGTANASIKVNVLRN